MKGFRLKGGETEIVKHSKLKGEETKRAFETMTQAGTWAWA